MRTCLVTPYGGQRRWVDLALRAFPEVGWLVLLANEGRRQARAGQGDLQDSDPSNPRNRGSMEGETQRGRGEIIETSDARNNNKPNETQTLWAEAKAVVADLRAREQDIPVPKRRHFSALNVPKFSQFPDLLAYFRTLHQFVASEGYDRIYVEIDAALALWRVALYQCAEEFRDIVRKVFIFNKETGEVEIIRIFRPLSDVETRVLALLGIKDNVTVTDLLVAYHAGHGDISLSYLLKTVNALAAEGLISEAKEGRSRWVTLTALGRAYLPHIERLQDIARQLRDEAKVD